MSTPVATPEAALSTVHETARHSLASALNEAHSAPAPAAEPAPVETPAETAPPPAVESPSTQQAAPVEGSPPPATPSPTPIDTANLSPEARRFLDMKGGDLNRALADALEYNNRLGRNAPPEQAPPEVVAPPVQAPPVQAAVDPAMLEQHVNQFLGHDPQCVQLVSQFKSLNAEWTQAEKGRLAADAATARHKAWLELPEIANEPFRKAEVEGQIRQFEQDSLLLQLRQANIEQKTQRLEAAFDGRAEGYRNHLLTEHQRKETETRAQQQRDKQIDDHAQALQSAWKPSLERIAKEKQFTPKQIDRLDKRAQDAALARLDRGLGEVPDVAAFLEKEAEAYLEELDDHHRERSAMYAAQATQRAAQPGSTGAPTAVATAEPAQINSLEDIHKRARRSLAERFGLR